MNQIKNLKELFFHEVQVMWSCEDLLVNAMPKMIANATNEGLKMSLAAHFAETQQHKTIMELIAKQLDIPVDGDFNLGMKGILEEGDMVLAKDATPEARDAVIIAAAQKVEHYEISGYGSTAYYAERLGYTAIASQIYKILEEERQADGKLNFLAKSIINERAVNAG